MLFHKAVFSLSTYIPTLYTASPNKLTKLIDQTFLWRYLALTLENLCAGCWHFNIYEEDKCRWAWKKLYNLGAWWKVEKKNRRKDKTGEKTKKEKNNKKNEMAQTSHYIVLSKLHFCNSCRIMLTLIDYSALNLLNKLILHFRQFSCIISIKTADTEVSWKTVWVLIRWLRQKPADLNLHCFPKKKYLGLAGQVLILNYIAVNYRIWKAT